MNDRVNHTAKENVPKLANELAQTFGTQHIFTTAELNKLYVERFGGSGDIRFSDYCYNRVNDGMRSSLESFPPVLEYVSRGRFRCLGEGYPYNGAILCKPKDANERIAGECANGVRRLK